MPNKATMEPTMSDAEWAASAKRAWEWDKNPTTALLIVNNTLTQMPNHVANTICLIAGCKFLFVKNPSLRHPFTPRSLAESRQILHAIRENRFDSTTFRIATLHHVLTTFLKHRRFNKSWSRETLLPSNTFLLHFAGCARHFVPVNLVHK